MTVQSFSLDGVTYRQQYRACGRSCSKCPRHGPYWFAVWWNKGRALTKYVGKELPAGIVPPSTRPAEPLPAPAMSYNRAMKVLGFIGREDHATAHKRMIARRKYYSRQGAAGKMAVVDVDAAWEVVMKAMGW